jgi:two-component system NtrC family sensor kinase
MYRMICVDDETGVLRALRRLFMDEDYEIEYFSSAQDALARMADFIPDLIISDYRMPEMNGVDFLKLTKNLYPDAVRIILSGYTDSDAIVSLINDGEIYKYITKPWDDQEMLITIRRALEQYDLLMENIRLAVKVVEQNELLQKINDELERRVSERTRELTYKNHALQTAHNILNHLATGILGVNDDGTIIMGNRMASLLLGIEAPKLIGHSIRDVLPPLLVEKITDLTDHLAHDALLGDPTRAPAELADQKICCSPLREGNTVYGTIVEFLTDFTAQSCR